MKKYTIVILRIAVALILIQTLRFKFTGHPESIEIFSKLQMEPYGRIGIGILELIAGLLILIPKTVWIGAALSIGLMLGALASHLTVLGVEVNDDGGLLFGTAIVTLCLSIVILYIHRKQIPWYQK